MPERKTGKKLTSRISGKNVRKKELVTVLPKKRTENQLLDNYNPVDKKYDVEIIHMTLFEVGINIDLDIAEKLVPYHRDTAVIKKRDAPDSLTLPKPLIVDLGLVPGFFTFSGSQITNEKRDIHATAKIYEEGVISIILKHNLKASLRDLHDFEKTSFNIDGIALDIDDFTRAKAASITELVFDAIETEEYESDLLHEKESYTAYRFLDVKDGSQAFFEENRRAIATLLSGEPFDAPLHERQMQRTLGNPFSYLEEDFALFDMDRCLIIDTSKDYDDLLLILEHANYQLLKLRALDRLLDKWLDDSERRLRTLYTGKRRRGRINALRQKFADMQSLRIEALFILENLENSSKIIGDCYFGEIYSHLCTIFNTEGWKWSVERRFDAIQDILEIVRGDISEQRTLTLEIIFIVVCIILPLVQILQVMISGS